MIVIMVCAEIFSPHVSSKSSCYRCLSPQLLAQDFTLFWRKVCHVNKALKVFTVISHKGLGSTCTLQIVDDITTKTSTADIYNQHIKLFMFLILYKPRDLNNNCLVLPFN